MFFAILWKLCSKYLPKQSPLFVNIPPGIIEDSTQLSQSTPALEGKKITIFLYIAIDIFG